MKMMEMILVNHFRELRFKSTIVNRAGIWPLGGVHHNFVSYFCTEWKTDQ